MKIIHFFVIINTLLERGFKMNRELKRQKLEMLEGAETLEEIILASWNIFKSKFTNYQEQVEFITAIDSKKDEFYRKE